MDVKWERNGKVTGRAWETGAKVLMIKVVMDRGSSAAEGEMRRISVEQSIAKI